METTPTTCFWRTCQRDSPTVIQLGTANELYAIQASNGLHPGDYDALDINMGCPERFSIQGGMGAALLHDRQRVKLIVNGLQRHISKPLTCKIRLLNDLENTIELVKTLEHLGLAAIAVHGRYVDQRPHQPAHMSVLQALSDAVSIPIIANGDIYKYEDIEKTRELTKCSSVMIARGALINCSIFSPSPLSPKQVSVEYLKNCINYENNYSHTKYTMLKMFSEPKGAMATKEPFYEELSHAKSSQEMLQIMNKEVERNEK